jgi:hypothetical protein
MPDLTRRVNNALAAAGSGPANDRVRAALEAYVADPDGPGATILLVYLEDVVGDQAALDALGMTPPEPGLVFCGSMGLVTPAERDEHRYDSSFGWGD